MEIFLSYTQFRGQFADDKDTPLPCFCKAGAISFLVIRRPADKTAILRHYKHTVRVAALLPKLLKNLYEDKVSGRMPEEDYAILSREYAEERETLKKKVKAHRDRLRRIEQSEGERKQFIKAIRKFMEMRTLTNQILRELIDHINVYEVEGRGKNRTQRVVIYYKFAGYLEIPSHLSAPNYKADLRQGVAVEYVSCEPTESARELFDEEYGVEAEKE